MKRHISLEQISDGKLYESHEMVKAGCGGCQGCSDCCRGMGDSIVLDPYDMYRLTGGLSKSPEELLQGALELGTVDGIVLPHLKMTAEDHCPFLNKEGRCSIHPYRPGLCRLFPLGRHYENNSYRYFIQIHECKKEPKTKVKIRKWIDTPEPERNEQFIADWHFFLRKLQDYAEETEEEPLLRTLSLYVLQQFFLMPYKKEQDFYEQFYKRLEVARAALQVE